MGNLSEPIQDFGCKPINPKYCETCVFAYGEAPWEDGPQKANCTVYSKDSGLDQPDSIYYEGRKCEFYRPREGSKAP